ncbi:reverse transcriptase [Plakobranchus ocellatus]|uniref:Reverse transcriptase n=1 Tax=Plakobranchus ocellatus TaxID=259542 RepID=A0AAV4DIT7_9GAST|nr:reverse transcriptase [Plakobranchus ocellatus]
MARFEGVVFSLKQVGICQKKTKPERETHENFFKDQFQFAKQLFQQLRSGILTVHKKKLETHRCKTYSDHSDPEREKRLEDIDGLVWPSAPGVKFNNKPPTLNEVNSVVEKARGKFWH